MISRRDFLLIRPWQERKYEDHRRKVQKAVPAIDNKPPFTRQHVNVKLKKQQKESDRIRNIERENHLLLQRLNYVMRTNRVDNFWKTPQPDFLNRIGIYNTDVPKYEIDESDYDYIDSKTSASRKSKCLACTPHKIKQLQVPEERIPWEPEKKPIGKIRSKSVPARKSVSFLTNNNVVTPQRPITSVHDTEKRPRETAKKRRAKLSEPQNITITKGCLKLSVYFPWDTSVKFCEGKNERIISRGLCCCKSLANLSTKV